MASDYEDDDEFYDSLDRIVSSSGSSTSVSDSESDTPRRGASLDVWIAEPSSIEDRRRRLLHRLGLAGDPSLSRQKPPVHPVQTGRSVSCNYLPPPPPAASDVVRSRSDRGSVDRTEAAVVVDEDEIARRRCTIRNLDTGKEFEVKEDGDWEKVREVGTGRHLSMDEFEITVGRSPIVQELMRRQKGEESAIASAVGQAISKKRGGWLASIKNAARIKHRDTRGGSGSGEDGRRSSSATDDSQDGHHGPERTRVHQCGKMNKELTGLFMSQEVKAHSGSIWSIKFSLDGKHLASAGEDCVIHVWRVAECEGNGVADAEPMRSASHWEKKSRVKVVGRKSKSSVDQLVVPEHVFALSEKPVCSFRGHLEDVLDLSWSKSQYLLSSSMDKTVRLWHLSSNSCLKTFSHSDYVTCIQFNPVDDRYFISGSLDEKVRIWSIPDRQVVDWHDLHEMVTAACYTPNGQGALVGSHKGSCHLYNTSDNKLLLESQIDLQNKKKKSSHKKITGFQCTPGSSSEVLVTSADSRIRVIEDTELIHKFKGFRNTSSQISACLTANEKYLICASEDSHVYVWRYDVSKSRASRSKDFVSVTKSYEHFHCTDLTVAVPWPPTNNSEGLNRASKPNSEVPAEFHGHSVLSTSATWPEEKLIMTSKYHSKRTGGSCNGSMQLQSWPAWGMVIVTAGRGGQIKTFQNFGFEVLI